MEAWTASTATMTGTASEIGTALAQRTSPNGAGHTIHSTMFRPCAPMEGQRNAANPNRLGRLASPLQDYVRISEKLRFETPSWGAPRKSIDEQQSWHDGQAGLMWPGVVGHPRHNNISPTSRRKVEQTRHAAPSGAGRALRDIPSPWTPRPRRLPTAPPGVFAPPENLAEE